MPKRYPVEKRLEVVLAGLRSEDSVRELCRQHGIETKTYYKWKNAFLEGGKQGLSGDDGEAGDSRARELQVEVKRLKELVADLSIENHLLKKSGSGKTNIEGY